MKRTMSWMIGTMTMLALSAGFALAGSTNAPAAPTDVASAMWTLNDIYNVMNTRTTNITLRGGQTAFVEPSSGPTGTMHTLNEIMALVTNRAPVAKASSGTWLTYLPSYTPVAGEDWYANGGNNGVAWPGTRFTDNGNGTVKDNLTDLIWLKNVNVANTPTNWSAALSLVVELNTSGTMKGIGALDTSNGGSHQTDWRLPNIRELTSLLDYSRKNNALPPGSPFAGSPNASWWTSSTYPADSAGTSAYSVSMANGTVLNSLKTVTTCYVWPVRGGR